MKNFNFLWVIMPVAFTLVSCGSNSPEDADFTAKSNTSISNPVVNVPPIVGPTGATGATGATGSTGTSSCNKSVITRPLYEFTLEGSRNGAVVTPTIPAGIVDSMLRVRITPIGALATSNAGGAQNFSKFGATLRLVRNGSTISGSSVILPGTSDVYNMREGIATSANSAIVNFASHLQSGATYAIRVSDVFTNWSCVNNATANRFGCSYYYNPYQSPYCGGYNYQYGVNNAWNFDYHTKQYVCCAGNQLQETQSMQCGIGPLTSANTGGWSVKVTIETDTSECMN